MPDTLGHNTAIMAENVLYYGDNLDILRRYIKDETIDLVYLDPPFKSNQDYNVLFAEKDGARSSAQIKAFEDTWQWDQVSARAYQEVVEAGGKVSQAMQAFHSCLGPNDMLAYLAMMVPRLVELRRVLKPTGSIYLHCDPTVSHYLKILMDAVLGGRSFVNEITWKRTTVHSDSKQCRKGFGNITDIILFCSKSDSLKFNAQYQRYGQWGRFPDLRREPLQQPFLRARSRREVLTEGPWTMRESSPCP
jgi:adenine specific DNA methylase Mod